MSRDADAPICDWISVQLPDQKRTREREREKEEETRWLVSFSKAEFCFKVKRRKRQTITPEMDEKTKHNCLSYLVQKFIFVFNF